jgi:hypothetical protein
MIKPQGNQLSRDANHIAIQFGNNFQAIDASGTPKKSPLTVSTVVLTIQPPKGAIRMVAYALTNPIRVSDESTAADHYFTLQTATQPQKFDITNEQPFFVLRDGAADGVLHFYFIYL